MWVPGLVELDGCKVIGLGPCNLVEGAWVAIIVRLKVEEVVVCDYGERESG